VRQKEIVVGHFRLDVVYGDKTAEMGLGGMYHCQVFYQILEWEERFPFLKQDNRQVKNLQRGKMECFATVTLEFVNGSTSLWARMGQNEVCSRQFPACVATSGARDAWVWASA